MQVERRSFIATWRPRKEADRGVGWCVVAPADSQIFIVVVRIGSLQRRSLPDVEKTNHFDQRTDGFIKRCGRKIGVVAALDGCRADGSPLARPVPVSFEEQWNLLGIDVRCHVRKTGNPRLAVERNMTIPIAGWRPLSVKQTENFASSARPLNDAPCPCPGDQSAFDAGARSEGSVDQPQVRIEFFSRHCSVRFPHDKTKPQLRPIWRVSRSSSVSACTEHNRNIGKVNLCP